MCVRRLTTTSKRGFHRRQYGRVIIYRGRPATSFPVKSTGATNEQYRVRDLPERGVVVFNIYVL